MKSLMFRMRNRVDITLLFAIALAAALTSVAAPSIYAVEPVSPEDILGMRLAVSANIGPDGKWITYAVRVPRAPGDEPGADYRELHVVSVDGKVNRPFVTGEVTVNNPRFSPDGKWIAFRMKRGKKAKTQVWLIPSSGGEARQVTKSGTNVYFFRWHPDGLHIAYTATTAPDARAKTLADKGYGFVFFEENLKHRNIYVTTMSEHGEGLATRQLTDGVTMWSFAFSPNGDKLAAAASTENLVDHRYVFRNVFLIDTQSGEFSRIANDEGKLGNIAFSPDGKKIAYAAARDRADHQISQAYVVDVSGGKPVNLTPDDFRGHISWVGWRNKDTIVYRAAEGVWNTLNTVNTNGKKRKQILEPADAGIIFGPPSFTGDFKNFAMTASTPDDPSNVYWWRPGKRPKRLTDLNPWAADRKLGGQEVIRYTARDGLEIEALLIYPVDYQRAKRYPLIVLVHGGPESRRANGWLTYYSSPVQVLAGKGYFVLVPNYRSSTAYGLKFTEDHMGDAAGKEFDDIADGIDFLADSDLIDRDRVGLGGGSYGGYAAAWFATYYTQYVRAVCVFNGITDLVSKRGTTNIPYEELFVHSGKKLEEMWDFSLRRSPIYYAEQSETAVLILAGANDPRVHPSQGLELYRRLRMNGHPAVRHVRYPGEKHGNAKQPGRIDVLHRMLDWYDWYVMNARSIAGPMPPLDISDRYRLELPD